MASKRKRSPPAAPPTRRAPSAETTGEGTPRDPSYVPRTAIKTRAAYLTHDNYKKPFRVVASADSIEVYSYPKNFFAKNPRGTPQEGDYTVLLKRFEAFQGYWPGHDTSPYKIHGTSILIKESSHEYVFIGEKIYRFQTEDEISGFASAMSNNDVPYPVAYGEKNVYFMLDRQFIAKSELTIPATLANAENLYGEFYGHLGNGQATKHAMKRVKILKKRIDE